MGIVVKENKDLYLYEAIGKAVVKTPLKKFITYTKEPIYKGQLKNKYKKLIPKAILFCEEQLGVPYDEDFLYNKEKHYYSKSIYDAFLYANNNEPFFQLFSMTYKEPNSEIFFPIWIEHFKKRGIPIREGKLGCNPGRMSTDEKINITLFNF